MVSSVDHRRLVPRTLIFAGGLLLAAALLGAAEVGASDHEPDGGKGSFVAAPKIQDLSSDEMHAITLEALVRDIDLVRNERHAQAILDHQSSMDELLERYLAEFGQDKFAGMYHEGDLTSSVLMIKGEVPSELDLLLQEFESASLRVSPMWQLSDSELSAIVSSAGEQLAKNNVEDFSVSADARTQTVHALVGYGTGESAGLLRSDAAEVVRASIDLVIGVNRQPPPVEIELLHDMSALGGSEHGFGGAELALTTGVQTCTTGFSIKIGSTKALLTAAHCNVWDSQPPNPDRYMYRLHNHEHQFLTADPTIAWHLGQWGDMRAITVDGTEKPKFFVSNNQRATVTGFQPRAAMQVNDMVCNYGRSSNQGTRCALIENTNSSKSQGGQFVANLVRLDRDFADDGDSGGPWFLNGVAYGVHQGNVVVGPGQDDPNFHRDAFTPISTPVWFWGATVLTG